MNENALKYKGLDRFECRKQIVKDLDKLKLLIKIEPIKHSVGHSERTDCMVEPYLSKQWFVKMDELAKHVLENQKTDNKVNFIPGRFEKILTHWMEDCHDWCISRQLWWGHRIPAWYKGDLIHVGDSPKEEGWVQDEDVLDTWFSSALWPFSTLGWPEETDLLKRYYPTNVLVTGYDIIFFWVCRMVFQGLEFTNNRPFENVLIHGLVRDSKGRKMSKSLGNGVDPMDVIEKYGCDSMRFFLTTSSAPGQDLRFDEEKVSSTWNFINKLWNASRFVFMNTEGFTDYTFENLSISDKWILTKLNKTIKKVKKHMDKYEFNGVGTILYNFIWDDFCDWYIELSKVNMSNTTKSVLLYNLECILKMLHPFMPYVTEEIYMMLPKHDESIMISKYPSYNKEQVFDVNFEVIIDLIVKIRKIKLENNLGKDFIVSYNSKLIKENVDIIRKLIKNEKILENYQSDLSKIEIPFENSIVTIYYDGTLSESEIEKLKKEALNLTNSIKRRENLLNNENYVNKAPKEIVENEKKSLEKEKKELEVISLKLK